MKLVYSKRIVVFFLIITIFLSAINTYLIFENIRIAHDQLADDSIFDYVIFLDGDTYKAKNQTSGRVDYASKEASVVLSRSISEGNSIFVKRGSYVLNADIKINNKKHSQISSNGAVILGNGNKIIFRGDDYTYSQNNAISSLELINTTIRIEDSFLTSISDVIFDNCSVGVEVVNTNSWTEGTKIVDCHFINCTESIAFRKPAETATGSYASTLINRCFFNLKDNSVGINIEEKAEYSDSQLQNSRMWLGENKQEINQTGLKMDGSMHETVLSGMVFESFATNPENMYAISIGESSVTTPNIGEGVSFLGKWNSRIYNPFSKWISGSGGVFRNINEIVPVGVNGLYGNLTSIHRRPLTIFSFKPRIQIEGTFATGEVITVRMRLELVDNVISESVEKVFTNTTTLWLSDDDLLRLYPSQDVIWDILVDAKSSVSTTNVIVKIDIYGSTV